MFLVFCNIGLDSGDTIDVPEAGDSGGLGVQSGNLHIKIQVRVHIHARFFLYIYIGL